MKDKIFELINKLISLSGSKYTKERLDSELSEYNEKINVLLEEIRVLKNDMSEDKYFDQSKKIIDQNLEVSLQTEIKNNTIKLNEVLKEYASVKNELENNTEFLNNAKQNITLYDEILKKSTSNAIKLDVGDNKYSEMSFFLEEKLSFWQKNKALFESKLSKIKSEETLINNKKEELEKEIKESNRKILSLREQIKDDKNYYDKSMVKSDEESLEKLERELKTVERQKLELLTTPFCLANDLKNLVNEEKHIESSFKLKELISVLETYPFINDNDINELKEELKRLNKDLKILKIKVANNDYFNESKEIVEKGTNLLDKVIKDLISDKEAIGKIAENINKERIPYFFDKIKEFNLDDSFNVILDNLFKHSTLIKNKLINELDEDIENTKLLIKKLEEKSFEEQDDSIKQKDLEEIKRLDNDIRLIERRLNSDKSILEIYEELDMLLSSLEFSEDLDYIKVTKIIEIKDYPHEIKMEDN